MEEIKIQTKKIVFVDIEKIKPNPRNRNKHPREQILKLVELFKHQGVRQPLVVSNQSGFLATGHGRLEAAKICGIKKLPVVFQDFDSPEQEFAFSISDNAVALWAELDLVEIGKDLPDLALSMDIDLLAIQDLVKIDFEEDESEPNNKNSDNSKNSESKCKTSHNEFKENKIVLSFAEEDYFKIMEACQNLIAAKGYSDLNSIFSDLVLRAASDL